MDSFENNDIFVASNYEQIIYDVCNELNIENPADIPPSQWDYCLMVIYERLIKPNRKVIYMPDNNTYNIDVVENYINIYIMLCKKYNQCISIVSFCSMLDISKNYLYNTLGSKASHLLEKLHNSAEQSHINRADLNPKAQTIHLAWLNKYAGWNGSGTNQHKQESTVLTAAELPKLTDNNT